MPRKNTTPKKTEPTTETPKKLRKPRAPADTASLTRRLNKVVYDLVDMVQKEDGLEPSEALDVVRNLSNARCDQYIKELEARAKIAELQEEYGDLIDFKIK